MKLFNLNNATIDKNGNIKGGPVYIPIFDKEFSIEIEMEDIGLNDLRLVDKALFNLRIFNQKEHDRFLRGLWMYYLDVCERNSNDINGSNF